MDTIAFNFAFILVASTFFNRGADASIGVNYGTVANNLPPPSQVARFVLESTTINRVRLFDANPAILKAFEHTGIEVSITVPNELIPQLMSSSFAGQWVEANVKPHFPATNIARILVGNEVLSTANRLLVGNLVAAMQTLYSALVDASMDSRIQISTPHSMGILAESTPPSAGRFREGYDVHVLKPLLDFLQATNSPFMVNPYPFFGCSADTLNYALFRPNPGVLDDNTKLLYTNMLDAQLDAVYSAVKLLGFDNIEIVIAETGWPSLGDPTQIGVDETTAAEYNTNLIRHVNSGAGTPLMPKRTFETYIFALFNEDMKPGPTSERNFGLFHPDMTPVYDAGIMRPTVAAAADDLHSAFLAKSSIPTDPNPAPTPPAVKGMRWCLPVAGADPGVLQKNIDFVCGSGYNCGPIQEGGTCFLPNTVRSHAAYAMNLYYQAAGRNVYECDFSRTGIITTVDPSYGKCKYT